MEEAAIGPESTHGEVLQSLREDLSDLWGAFEHSDLEKIDWGVLSAMSLTEKQLLHSIYWNMRTLQLISLTQTKALGLLARILIEREDEGTG